MGTASALGGVSSFGAGRLMNAKEINLQKMELSSVLSPEGVWGNIASTTGSAAPTSITQSGASVIAENLANVGTATVQKAIEEKIDSVE
jgi:hypothetical protein